MPTLREQARELVITEITNAVAKEHQRNYHHLYVEEDGTIRWSETISRQDRAYYTNREGSLYDNLIEEVLVVGTGSSDCNCDYCEAIYDKHNEDVLVEMRLGSDEESWDKEAETAIRLAYAEGLYPSKEEAVADAVVNADTTYQEERALELFDAIAVGYFDDEEDEEE